MTINNRDSFLNTLAENLGRPRRTAGVDRPEWSLQPQHDIFKDASPDDLAEILEKQCTLIHTDFKRTTVEGLGKTLQTALDAYEVESIITPRDERNEMFGLTDFYENLGKNELDVRYWNPDDGQENIHFAEQADVGITFSDITLAESATVTLFNNKNNSRSLSLLPKSYIAIIPKSTLVPRLTQAMEYIHKQHKRGVPISSCVSFISGPSNSADIEMNLIVGVHGPIQATYILIEDDL